MTITLREFSAITKWNNRFCSMKSELKYSFGESLCKIALQFNVDGKWIYAPTIVWRGDMNRMQFPMFAVDRKCEFGAVINNTEELEEYANKWRTNDFSMLALPTYREVITNANRKPYNEFKDEVFAKLIRNKSIVNVNIMDMGCVTLAIYQN